MIRINNIRVNIGEDVEQVKRDTAKKLNIRDMTVSKKSLDARRKDDIHYVFSFDGYSDDEDKLLKNKKFNIVRTEKYEYIFPASKSLSKRPVIVGAGPAGLFAGLVLAQNGYAPVLLERGRSVDERVKDVESFWNGGNLDPRSNVQFGEGGAGTFSDGKLTTNIKDERIKKVLSEFVKHGAPEEILYLSKPHIGTDNLRKIVKSIRREITSLGGEIRFENRFVGFEAENGSIKGVYSEHNNEKYFIETDNVILAIGHSARDTLYMLRDSGIDMRQKPFSIGCRIEHNQEMISKGQYGDMYRLLPPADYKTAVHLDGGRSVYTFCMCVGGLVIQSASEFGGIVTNGMSNFARNEINANSALLVNVDPSDFGGDDVLAGVELQRRTEEKAFLCGGGNYNAPAQLVGDFLEGRASEHGGKIIPSIKPGVKWGDMRDIFPDYITASMREGIILMDKRISGFADPDAVLTAPETRSSSPVRFVRDGETMQLNINGLYSAGEGGGHAGGITSAAVDGIKCAERLVINNRND
ncbi:MAG: hypothetical protein J1F64_01000 [Oscillospiraceae bacterium]|nr:hypothetical protein [Oscillospiraceae bacterium]